MASFTAAAAAAGSSGDAYGLSCHPARSIDHQQWQPHRGRGRGRACGARCWRLAAFDLAAVTVLLGYGCVCVRRALISSLISSPLDGGSMAASIGHGMAAPNPACLQLTERGRATPQGEGEELVCVCSPRSR